MELIDIDLHSHEDCLRTILNRGTAKHQLLYNDRALRFFRTFIESIQQEKYYELPSATEWFFSREPLITESPYVANSFIINPVVDPLARKVHSFQFSNPVTTGLNQNVLLFLKLVVSFTLDKGFQLAYYH